MGLQRSLVLAAFEASLLDAAGVFGEPETEARGKAMARCIDAAVADFNRVFPIVREASLTMIAGVANYGAPVDAIRFHSTPLVDQNAELAPYDCRRVPEVPLASRTFVSGVRSWCLRPTPSARILVALGAEYPYLYFAAHVLSETPANSTITEELQPLLILRAQHEAMKDLAIRNAHKPVALRDSQYSQTRNGTPAALAATLLEMFEQQARETASVYRSM